MSIPRVISPPPTPAFPQAKALAPASSESSGFKPFGDDGLSFADLLDIINPLHHLPIIGSLYRAISGDSIDPASRVAGSALFGGPIGAAFAAANVALEHFSGDDMEGHVAALVQQEQKKAPLQSTVLSIDPVTVALLGLSPVKSPEQGENILAGREPPALQAFRSGVAPANERPSARPGGWLVGAAHAGIDAYQEALAEKRENRVAVNKMA